MGKFKIWINFLILDIWLNWPTSKNCMYAKINFKSFFLSHTIKVHQDNWGMHLYEFQIDHNWKTI